MKNYLPGYENVLKPIGMMKKQFLFLLILLLLFAV